MIRIPKAVVSFGALALVAGVLTLAVPRAAHAVAAALVQVSNPPASPANTEDISRQADQLVQLTCEPSFDNINHCSSGASQSQYVVPNNQSLVITSVEFNSFSLGSNAISVFLNGNGGGSFHSWLINSSANTTNLQYRYPSGIVLPPGTAPIFSFLELSVQMNGYLTTN